jgi:DNA-binding transcriptional MerR regulator
MDGAAALALPAAAAHPSGVPTDRPHGRFLAGEAADLVGVSGTTIGQWARRGYIRASRSTGDPHVYSLEDVAEAWLVHALLARGIGHAAVRRTIAALDGRGPWPLLTVPLGTTDEDGAPRVVLCEPDGPFALSGRGWQRLAVAPAIRTLDPPRALALLTIENGGSVSTDGR